ncbi:hypothetical protein FC19_GL000937 [Liquorilactobacillus aquaticus DSM 21051]|uniref:Uncharacterized protein n=1 Tax=Liquorilactobacillus aquaticus DSM 21051 TaxID=1423725 RepID=A0A0R2CXG0_9LACO|nr:hypothetical protein [Liquorilactobacillus aquaticus]KRM96639.1 hypothetical protein FC19_GL000937 [Liquorilactobacillus aquaticus DSM 21051]
MQTSQKIGLIGVIASTAVIVYCSHHQLHRKGKQAKAQYMGLKDDLHEIIDKTGRVSKNFKNLSHDIDKYSPVFEELMDEINEFQFLIKPHLDKIEKSQSK